jgi:hydroxymethylbilane synthase
VAAPDRIILGSRGSELALTQTRMVEQALRSVYPATTVEIKVIRTGGDERRKSAPRLDPKGGRKGLFTREIERELSAGRIDLAIHSAKDLPSEEPDDLEIGATLPRGKTEDVLITTEDFGLTTLPAGATIATGSIRRQRQLRWQRPDLFIVDLRGNVPTRLRKLRENKDWSGIVLARIGLERLGLEWQGEALPEDKFLSAGGQGIIAIQARRGDETMRKAGEAIDDRATHLCLRAEREFLRLLNGDCNAPVGVRARILGDELQIRAQIFEAEPAPRTAFASGSAEKPEKIAAELMEKIHEN